MRRVLLLTTLLLCSLVFFAQSAVKGKITDSNTGNPVSGASVRVKSTKKGMITGDDGIFSLQASPTDILEISFVGYKSQSVKVNGLTDIPISLEAGVTDLNEVVVVGSRGAPRVRTESPV